MYCFNLNEMLVVKLSVSNLILCFPSRTFQYLCRNLRRKWTNLEPYTFIIPDYSIFNSIHISRLWLALFSSLGFQNHSTSQTQLKFKSFWDQNTDFQKYLQKYEIYLLKKTKPILNLTTFPWKMLRVSRLSSCPVLISETYSAYYPHSYALCISY